jgi:gephyrin
MPSTFVTLNYKDKKKCIFCLPGNPVSAGVCTHLFLLPYLRLISGRKSIVHSFKAKANTHLFYNNVTINKNI